MSGNIGNSYDLDIFKIIDQMRKIVKYLSEMRSKFEQNGKIIMFEFEEKFNKILNTIQEFLKNGKYIILKDALQQMMSFERLSSCIAYIASTIINMENCIITDKKLDKDRILRVSILLADVKAKVEEYSIDIVNLGSRLEEIIRDEEAEKRQINIKILDLKIDTLSINVKWCITRVLHIKDDIESGARASQEQYINTAQKLERYANIAQAASTIGSLFSWAMGYSNTVPSGSETAVKSKALFWGKGIARTAVLAGGITTAGASYGLWRESKNNEEIQGLYKKLVFDAQLLEDELIRLQELIELYKRNR